MVLNHGGIKMRRCGMVPNETTNHLRPNNVEVNTYRSQHSVQQWTNPIPHCTLYERPQNCKCKMFEKKRLTAYVMYKTMKGKPNMWKQQQTITTECISIIYEYFHIQWLKQNLNRCFFQNQYFYLSFLYFILVML